MAEMRRPFLKNTVFECYNFLIFYVQLFSSFFCVLFHGLCVYFFFNFLNNMLWSKSRRHGGDVVVVVVVVCGSRWSEFWYFLTPLEEAMRGDASGRFTGSSTVAFHAPTFDRGVPVGRLRACANPVPTSFN